MHLTEYKLRDGGKEKVTKSLVHTLKRENKNKQTKNIGTGVPYSRLYVDLACVTPTAFCHLPVGVCMYIVMSLL